VLDQQRTILYRTVAHYQQHSSNTTITAERVQERLAKMKQESNVSTEVQQAMQTMEEAARLAVCKLVLYSECHRQDDDANNNQRKITLQKDGRLDRSRLLEFIALCQTAVKLHCVKQHLIDGLPLFEDVPKQRNKNDDDQKEEPTAMRFPQMRLERIQRLLSQAVGWDPDFTTKEMRRIFLEGNNEYSNDQQVLDLFQQLVMQMNTAVTNASLQASEQQLSDMDKGGVTRVVSVQYSEVAVNPNTNTSEPGDNGSSSSSTWNANAPTKLSIDPQLSQEEQKRQIRMASNAAALQQALLGELFSLRERDRNSKLDEAKAASEDFLKTVMSLPPGQDRVAFLQSIDPHTSRLLAMHKLWTSMLAANGGMPPKMAKKT
jgi:hypothetical protein